jgi:hypothetical protein
MYVRIINLKGSRDQIHGIIWAIYKKRLWKTTTNCSYNSWRLRLKLHPRNSRMQRRRVHAMGHAVSCWPLTEEIRVPSQASLVDKVALGQAFL